jgi:hypothetical protein
MKEKVVVAESEQPMVMKSHKGETILDNEFPHEVGASDISGKED